MSTYSSVEWTCDRCGVVVKVGAHVSPPEQPFRWGALWLVRPPLMAPSDSDQRPDQICGTCVDDYFDWFTDPSRKGLVRPASA